MTLKVTLHGAHYFKVAALALLFTVPGTQAASMPPPDELFGIVAPGFHTRNESLPDTAPNVVWFQFELAESANVTLDTFGSALDDSIMGLFDPAGLLLGQNDDCAVVPAPPNSFQSCLFFRNLLPASYLVGVVEYTTTGKPLYETIEFEELWELSIGTMTGDDNVTLNIGVAVPEPASLALFGLGLAGFGFSRRGNPQRE